MLFRSLHILILCFVCAFGAQTKQSIPNPNRVRMALIHFAPKQGGLEYNRKRIEEGTRLAIKQGAQWIVTPELAVSGYEFVSTTRGDRLDALHEFKITNDSGEARPTSPLTPARKSGGARLSGHRVNAYVNTIDADWIQVQPDLWTGQYMKMIKKCGVTAFLGTPEKDAITGKRHNALLVMGPQGEILGRHRKIAIHEGPIEGWAVPGNGTEPLQVGPLKVGMLICADAYLPDNAAALKAKGAQFLLSAAAWPSGEMGPNGVWESRSKETGLPFVICNRTGVETLMDFTSSESAVIEKGRRVFTHASREDVVIMLEYRLEAKDFDPAQFRVTKF